ncbi:11589_t:CDS:2 [Funneliformis geosporum]|nr:11589_t:CDS:2 [Funneliformis geosporum]
MVISENTSISPLLGAAIQGFPPQQNGKIPREKRTIEISGKTTKYMTNPQKKKKTEILETWTNLKHKLNKLVYLDQNKGLIKDALEIYLNQSSSFLSGHEESGLVNPSLPPGFTRVELETAYQSQKEKNKKIVRECKELLKELDKFC